MAKVFTQPDLKSTRLGVRVTGILHTIRLGPTIGSSEYSTRNRQELVGHSQWPPARFEGSFDVVKASGGGSLGRLNISGLGDEEGPYTPLIEAHFGVKSEAEEGELTRTLQASVAAGKGYSYLNFTLRPLEQDPEEWIKHFKVNGYSNGLDITDVVVGSQTGGPFT